MGEPLVIGDPIVTDTLAAITGDRVSGGALRRHAAAFFQGNRFLLRDVLAHVTAQVMPDTDVVDLYSGAGLFSGSRSWERRSAGRCASRPQPSFTFAPTMPTRMRSFTMSCPSRHALPMDGYAASRRG